MNTYFHHVITYFENVIHPAAGRVAIEKKRKRSSIVSSSPKATPDSLNIRDIMKKQDSFRRNPAP